MIDYRDSFFLSFKILSRTGTYTYSTSRTARCCGESAYGFALKWDFRGTHSSSFIGESNRFLHACLKHNVQSTRVRALYVQCIADGDANHTIDMAIKSQLPSLTLHDATYFEKFASR
jgi:hypothetical protein